MHHPIASDNPIAQRVIARLTRTQVDYLDKIGKDAQFSAGVKLSRTEIISALVNVLRHLRLTGNGVESPEQFEQRVLQAIVDGAPKGRGNGRTAHPPITPEAS